MNYDELMKRVLKLAMKGSGYVSPNPRVGAVIVRDGQIISEGWHKKFGEPHAEVEAIGNAGNIDFSGCTLVVNLEPCSHYGKTPPCTTLIIEKNFKRVVVGIEDPNPLVAGNGIIALRDAGIDVICGVLEKGCKWLNRFFIKYITTNQPYVILKIAQSVNGCIATSAGQSQWITSAESRKRTHSLRAQIDAILIGKNTALKDNPQLTVRDVQGRNPYRVILDTSLSLPNDLTLFNDEESNRTVIFCDGDTFDTVQNEKFNRTGINIIPVRKNSYGKIDLQECLNILSSEFLISSIMVEGGAEIYSAFLNEDLVDEIQIFQAPLIIGNGMNAFSSVNTDILAEASKFKIKAVSKSDTDLHFILVK